MTHNKFIIRAIGAPLFLLFLVCFSKTELLAQTCTPFYFEVCKVLPNVNSYPPSPNNPGAFQAFYKVKLRTGALGNLPAQWSPNYLAFSGKVDVNGFTSRINVELTNQFSQSSGGAVNPYFQYLTVTESGEVSWVVGTPANCMNGEPGTNLMFPAQKEVELFTIVVDGVPGDIINFGGSTPGNWVGDVKDCNTYNCTGTIPVQTCSNQSLLMGFVTPAVCNPQRAVSYELFQVFGQRIIQVSLNGLSVNEAVKKSDMVIHISPQMNGINNLDLNPVQLSGGPAVHIWKKVPAPDGSVDIYVNVDFFVATAASMPIFGIEVLGQYNLSQGAKLVCSMGPGRGVFSFMGSPNSICSLTDTPTTITIPGFDACSDKINVTPTRDVGPNCSLGVKYTITHNSPTPLSLSSLRLRFVFDLTNGNNAPGTVTTTLPCPTCGQLSFNAALGVWEYNYNQTTALTLNSGAEVVIPFNLSIDCIKYYVVQAEATPAGGATCAMGVTFDLSQWPACDPGVRGSVGVDNGGSVIKASNYTVTLESTIDNNYHLSTQDDCQDSYSFCPDPTKAPFQLHATSSTPQAYLCGVTTYDLVLISKHILGIAPILEPKTLIAADASLKDPSDPGSANGVTTFDIVQIRKCILGIFNDFGPFTAPSWWYFKDGYTFLNPPINPPYTGSDISSVPANGQGPYGVFFSVKVGDINHTCNCGMKPGASEDAQAFLKTSTSAMRREGNQVLVPIWSDAPFDLIAAQTGFRFDPSLMRLQEIIPNPELDIQEANFGIDKGNEGEIKFAWSAMDGITGLPKKALLFTLRFELKDNAELPTGPLCWTTDDVLQSLVYQEDGSEYPVRLAWNERAQDRVLPIGLIVSPNPFETSTTAFIYTEKPIKAGVTISDGRGQVFSQETIELHSGDNAVQLEPSSSAQPGIYFITIQAEGQTLQRRIVKL